MWAMAAMPELAPSFENHILSSTSVLQTVKYKTKDNNILVSGLKKEDAERAEIFYTAFDKSGQEKIRLTSKPSKILINNKAVSEIKDSRYEGFIWTPFKTGGVLMVNRIKGVTVIILN